MYFVRLIFAQARLSENILTTKYSQFTVFACVSGYPSSIAPPVDAQEEAVRRYGLTPQSDIVKEPLQGGGVDGCGQESPTTASQTSVNDSTNQESRITTNGKSTIISVYLYK